MASEYCGPCHFLFVAANCNIVLPPTPISAQMPAFEALSSFLELNNWTPRITRQSKKGQSGSLLIDARVIIHDISIAFDDVVISTTQPFF